MVPSDGYGRPKSDLHLSQRPETDPGVCAGLDYALLAFQKSSFLDLFVQSKHFSCTVQNNSVNIFT